MSSEDMVCFTIGLNYVTSSNQYFPCGASNATDAQAQSCCYAGDVCMEDSICHYTHGGVTNGTGYYMAGCTDSSWKDPACPKQCTSEYGADIVYDSTSGHWDCCRSTEDSLNCQEPSDMGIDAPSPNNLVVIKQLTQAVPSTALTTGIGMISSVASIISETTSISSASTSASLSASITSASTATTTASTADDSASSSSTPSTHASGALSAGAQAGITVGVIIATMLAALSAVLFWRKTKRQRRRPSEAALSEMNADQKHPFVTYSSGEAYPYYGPKGHSGYGLSELPMNPSSQIAAGDAKLGLDVEMYGLRPQELDTERTRQELPGHPSEK
ncbi:hypothetical protein Tdes44962_MAKER02252 [Teratosphaeria destructans]|uniref:Uncharacterized protein n=1 Tax=Teratosphaeria destructans TaxID=418781 RepID=A0A9W7W3E9_9PEZI|nr:hypothetical protein Tdes44962_MAKER02252 [Teratosphaeria destructans]